jgi:hypothetical protein
MKLSDVRIGMPAWIRVSGKHRAVIVTEEVPGTRPNQKTQFRVRRIGEKEPLPTLRAPAALHLTINPDAPGEEQALIRYRESGHKIIPRGLFSLAKDKDRSFNIGQWIASAVFENTSV